MCSGPQEQSKPCKCGPHCPALARRVVRLTLISPEGFNTLARHPGSPVYGCYLPVLTGFAVPRRAGPFHQRRVSPPGPRRRTSKRSSTPLRRVAAPPCSSTAFRSPTVPAGTGHPACGGLLVFPHRVASSATSITHAASPTPAGLAPSAPSLRLPRTPHPRSLRSPPRLSRLVHSPARCIPTLLCTYALCDPSFRLA
jgi:hypothetical protein